MIQQQFDNTDRGVLFKNDKTAGNPAWPDYKGSINVGGVDYWLSAWIKDGKKGKFMSLSVKPKEERSNPAPAARPAQRPAPPVPKQTEEDESVPF